MTITSIGAKRNSIGFGRLNPKPISKAFQLLLEQIWLDGASVFVKSLAEDMIVETGESAGSLEPLARFTNTILRFRAASNSKVKKPILNTRTGKAIPGTRRSFSTGVTAGESAFNIETAKGKFLFTFKVPVFQFFLHESGRNNGPDTRLKGALDRALQRQKDFVRKEYRTRAQELLATWFVTGKVKRV